MKRKKERKIRGESEKRGSFLETGNEHSEFVEMTGRVYLRDPSLLFTKNLLKSRDDWYPFGDKFWSKDKRLDK